MVAPSRSAAVKRRSNVTKTASALAGHRGELRLSCPSVADSVPALLDQSSLRIEQILSTNLHDRAEFHSWAGFAHLWNRDGGLCRAYHEGLIKAPCPAGMRYRSNTALPPALRCASS
jgi:hypothetical protein